MVLMSLYKLTLMPPRNSSSCLTGLLARGKTMPGILNHRSGHCAVEMKAYSLEADFTMSAVNAPLWHMAAQA